MPITVENLPEELLTMICKLSLDCYGNTNVFYPSPDTIIKLSLLNTKWHRIAKAVLKTIVYFPDSTREVRQECAGQVRHVFASCRHTRSRCPCEVLNHEDPLHSKLFSDVLRRCDNLSILSLKMVALDADFFEWSVGLPRPIEANLLRYFLYDTFFPAQDDTRKIQFSSLKLLVETPSSDPWQVSWEYRSITNSLKILQLHYSDLVRVELDVDELAPSLDDDDTENWTNYWIRPSVTHLRLNFVELYDHPDDDPLWPEECILDSAILLVNRCHALEELVLTAPYLRARKPYSGTATVTAKITKVQAPRQFLCCFNDPSCQLEELSISTPFDDNMPLNLQQVGALRKLRVQMGENEFNESNRLTRLVEEIVGLEEIEADWVDGQEIINNLTFKSNISILKYNELDVRTANPDLLQSKIEENQDGISLEQFWLNGYVIWRRHQE
ncbi:hypothetical protein C8R42DRAFT_717283 [Lentinula raphanica]|nr:hypothetical protein C8R42DRAFT_717283 [Lentinula raphanica]